MSRPARYSRAAAPAGVVAVGHGRRVVRLNDTPCFGRPVLVRWRTRIWRCAEKACAVSTWTEDHSYAGARSKLTTRAIAWAVDALRHDDTTVSAIARHLGVDWHTAWDAIGAEAERRINKPERLQGVQTLGVDEHIWRPSMRHTNKAVTVMVDLTRDESGCLHARLLDAVEGRSGTVYANWLKDEGLDVKVTVEHAALDPFRGYANAIRGRSARRCRRARCVSRCEARLDCPRRGPASGPARPCTGAGSPATRFTGSGAR